MNPTQCDMAEQTWATPGPLQVLVRHRPSNSVIHPEKTHLTLGIMAFNSQQQALIFTLLEEMRLKTSNLNDLSPMTVNPQAS